MISSVVFFIALIFGITYDAYSHSMCEKSDFQNGFGIYTNTTGEDYLSTCDVEHQRVLDKLEENSDPLMACKPVEENLKCVVKTITENPEIGGRVYNSFVQFYRCCNNTCENVIFTSFDIYYTAKTCGLTTDQVENVLRGDLKSILNSILTPECIEQLKKVVCIGANELKFPVGFGGGY